MMIISKLDLDFYIMNRLSDESLSVALLSFLRNIEKDDLIALKDKIEDSPYSNETFDESLSVIKKLHVCSKFSISDTIDSISTCSERV